MPLVQDRSLDLLTSSLTRYHCATDAPRERERERERDDDDDDVDDDTHTIQILVSTVQNRGLKHHSFHFIFSTTETLFCCTIIDVFSRYNDCITIATGVHVWFIPVCNHRVTTHMGSVNRNMERSGAISGIHAVRFTPTHTPSHTQTRILIPHTRTLTLTHTNIYKSTHIRIYTYAHAYTQDHTRIYRQLQGKSVYLPVIYIYSYILLP